MDRLLQKEEILIEDEEEVVEEQTDTELSGLTEEVAGTSIFVYICGAVQNPGVYELPDGSRVFQLVDAAGGFTEQADGNSINLAETVEDGGMIRIYTIDEIDQLQTVERADLVDPAGGAGSDGRININTADPQQLQTLSGIGESKAADIVAYRESNGSFRTVEDIMNVSGIGENTFDKIKDFISVE